MKELDDYNLIRDFLGSQGIQPTVAMLCVDNDKWYDLVGLARLWRQEADEYAAKQEATLADMTEDELRMMEKAKMEAQHKENEKTLFYSSGHKSE